MYECLHTYMHTYIYACIHAYIAYSCQQVYSIHAAMQRLFMLRPEIMSILILLLYAWARYRHARIHAYIHACIHTELKPRRVCTVSCCLNWVYGFRRTSLCHLSNVYTAPERNFGIHTYVHTYMRTYIHTYVHTYIHTYSHTLHVHTRTYTYIHVHTGTFIHTCTQVCICSYA